MLAFVTAANIAVLIIPQAYQTLHPELSANSSGYYINIRVNR